MPSQAITVEALTEPTNNAVIRLPGRKYPAIAIQGDSLWSLRSDAESILQNVRNGRTAELEDEARSLCEALDQLLRHYEKCLADNGIDLPYKRL